MQNTRNPINKLVKKLTQKFHKNAIRWCYPVINKEIRYRKEIICKAIYKNIHDFDIIKCKIFYFLLAVAHDYVYKTKLS